jgi:hypothetical protein
MVMGKPVRRTKRTKRNPARAFRGGKRVDADTAEQHAQFQGAKAAARAARRNPGGQAL